MFFEYFNCVCSRVKRETRKNQRGLVREFKRKNRALRVLLLGPGDSGKSTFLRQLKFLNGEKLCQDERIRSKKIVYSNIVRGMQILYDAAKTLQLPFSQTESEDFGENLSTIPSLTEEISVDDFQNYSKIIKYLWQDTAIQTAYSLKINFSMDYVPTFVDAIRCRKITKGIEEYYCKVNKVPFIFFDVGGQRSQRKIWLECFERIVSIIFIVPSGDFDQVSFLFMRLLWKIRKQIK